VCLAGITNYTVVSWVFKYLRRPYYFCLLTTSERKTEVLYGADNALQRGVYFMSHVKNKMDIYFDNRGSSIVINIDEYRNGYRDIKRRGGKIRLLTEITSENIEYCKQLMNIVDEFRHVDGIKGGLAVSETEFMATTMLEEGTPLAQVIYSNVKEMVEQGQYIFDSLWANTSAIPAKQRIKEIEQGVIREIIETLRDLTDTQKRAFDLLKSASDEILIILPTAKALQILERLGLTQLLSDATQERSVKIRLLVGRDGEVEAETEKLRRNWETMEIHGLQTALQTKLLVIVVDNALSLAIELKKDEMEEDLYDAIGLATYSNSESTVLTYSSIFENLWIQGELHKEKKKRASQA
jgi:two-component system, OmpR family, sensor histidine kinase VicK